MTGRNRYTVACLAGHGVGPEMMGEASRTLEAVSRLHGFHLDQVHVPFDREAFSRSGHPLPGETRTAYRSADAILVAGANAAALAGVKAELDLTATVVRVRLQPGGDLNVFAPCAGESADWAIERAFACANARQGRLTSVGTDDAWRQQVEAVAERYPGLAVRHLTLAEALPVLETTPALLDVLVTEQVLAEAIAGVPRARPGGTRVLAHGFLSPTGPGLFGPTHGAALDIAGQGVANPSGILLAAALLLGDGLDRRAAADTLVGGVTGALDSRVRTPDLAGEGLAATTREFVDVVLDLLPGARTDVEFTVRAAT
jgi:3-isopropylmalate dehydrogenase